MRLPPLEECPSISEALCFHREHNPKEPLYVFSAHSAQEPTSVTFEEFGRACDRVAQFVRPGRVGGGPDGTVVALLLVTDVLLYQATLVGIMTSGYAPFPISHRLSPQAVIHLLMKASCHHLMVTSATLPTGLLDTIKQEFANNHPGYVLSVVEMPSPCYIYPSHWGITASDCSYPVQSQHSSPDDVALYFHSSGSTGLPKLVPHTSRVICSWAILSLPEVKDFEAPSRRRYATMALPPAHGLAHVGNTIFAIYHGFTAGLYPPTGSALNASPIIPTPENFLEHAERTQCTGIITSPIYLQAWARSESNVKELAKFEHIVFAGGPLATEIGDALVAAGVNLQSVYGATEFGITTKFFHERGREKDWEWLQFVGSESHEFVGQGNGTYEYHFMSNGAHRPSVINRPDGRGYASSDLFVKHPTNDNLWKVVGRLDDVVIHSTGVKTVPGPIEAIVLSNPLVNGAIVFGRGRDRAGILIEPTSYHKLETPEGVHEFRELIWASIEIANRAIPLYSRILQDMVLLTSENKPLPRTLKGTVMRKLALEMYEEEVDDVYRDFSNSDNNIEQSLEFLETPIVEKWLLEQIYHVLPGRLLSLTNDLFEQGLDSIGASFLRRRILNQMMHLQPSTRNNITESVIYAYPTIHALAQHLCNVVGGVHKVQPRDERISEINAMIDKYSIRVPPPISPPAEKSIELGSPIVLLTGSTGHLGCHLLAGLLDDTKIKVVYAFNRPASLDIKERHYVMFKNAGLDAKLLETTKLIFVQGDIAQPYLGVTKELYREIQQSVTLVIHNSWRIDHNLTLTSYEPQLRGVQNLANFVHECPHGTTVRIIFTSSIASAQSWEQSLGPYPERLIQDARFAVGAGYGEGKYIAERILELSGLNVCSIRLGQLSGSSKEGTWAPVEWFPALVKSSLTLGGFPSAPGIASWVPIDYAAQSILELAFTKGSLPSIINFAHPRPIKWNVIIEATRAVVVDVLKMDTASLPLIPFPEWLKRLMAKAENVEPGSLETLPSLKMLSFFRAAGSADEMSRNAGTEDGEFGGLATLDLNNVMGLSVLMQSIPTLEIDSVKKWVGYWTHAGFLKTG